MSTVDGSTFVGNTETSVGHFSILLGDINPAFQINSYPNSWTKYEYTISGLTTPVKGRFGFRYAIPNGVKAGVIGIDKF